MKTINGKLLSTVSGGNVIVNSTANSTSSTFSLCSNLMALVDGNAADAFTCNPNRGVMDAAFGPDFMGGAEVHMLTASSKLSPFSSALMPMFSSACPTDAKAFVKGIVVLGGLNSSYPKASAVTRQCWACGDYCLS